jgi:hypothetical protein
MGSDHASRLRIRLFPRSRLGYLDLQVLPASATLDRNHHLGSHRKHRWPGWAERFAINGQQNIGGQQASRMSRSSVVDVSNHPAFAGIRLSLDASRANREPRGNAPNRFVKEPCVAGAKHRHYRMNARFKRLRFRNVQNLLSAALRDLRPVGPAKLRIEIKLRDFAAGVIVNARPLAARKRSWT